ncbi:MAG: FtsX-like permease family protein [Muribaculaceae bacterium]|nr:FtsX-like permease family protein [Muribaculaceae bacterium]
MRIVAHGATAKGFARRINRDPELRELGRLGILELKEAKAYREFNGADSILSPKERYRNVLMVFFAINIFLGVFGTFWLLTRKRTEEAGIMRAFGATPRRVRMMLYVEGIIIALGSSLIGCAIYVYYLSKNPESFEYGLNSFLRDRDMSQLPPELHTWVGDFWAHSAVVTAVVCALMLIVVLVGIAIPAWKLSRITPVEALADE